MKTKLLFATVLFGMSTLLSTTHAQVLDLPDFNSGKPMWIIRAGVNFNNAVGDWKDEMKDSWEGAHRIDLKDSSFPSNTSFDVSFGFNKSFGNRPLYWGMELGFSTRGYKTNAEWASGHVSETFGDYIGHVIKEKQTLTAYNVNLVPFTIGYKYTFLDRMAVDVHLGAFVSYDFAGKMKIYNYDWSTSSGRDRVKENTTSTKISKRDKYSDFDAGINLGVGYWYGHFNIDFSWQRGFIDMFDTKYSMQTQSLKLRLGYCF